VATSPHGVAVGQQAAVTNGGAHDDGGMLREHSGWQHAMCGVLQFSLVGLQSCQHCAHCICECLQQPAHTTS